MKRLFATALTIALAACAHRAPESPVSASEALEQFAIPHEAKAWHLRGLVAEARDDLTEADRAFEWMVRMDRRSAWAWRARGRYYERQGRLREALKSYAKAVQLGPQHPALHSDIGRVELRLGDAKEAELHLIEACHDGIGEACGLLGELYVERGDATRAAEALQWWTEIDGDRLARAELAMAVDRHDLAVDDLLATLLESASPSPEVARLLVEAAERSCRWGTAWAWFDQRGAAWWESPWPELALRVADGVGDRELEAQATAVLEASNLPVPVAHDTSCPAMDDVVAATESLSPCSALSVLDEAWDRRPLDPVVATARTAARRECGE